MRKRNVLISRKKYIWHSALQYICVFVNLQAILYYYQSGGRLRRPLEVPEDVFIEELEFYEMDDSLISEFKQKEGFVVERREMPTTDWQRFIWLLCEEPNSSLCARAFAAVSVSSIIVSIVNFCTETIPVFADRPVCVNVTDSDGRTRQVSFCLMV